MFIWLRKNILSMSVCALGLISFHSHSALAACVHKSSEAQVEANFCAADAVFTGEVEQVTKTDVFDEKGKDAYEARSKVKIFKSYKGILANDATLVTDLNASHGDYYFKDGKQYLIFAHKIAPGEYVGDTGACAAQVSMDMDQADASLKRLAQQASGAHKIDCDHKSKPTKAHSKKH